MGPEVFCCFRGFKRGTLVRNGTKGFLLFSGDINWEHWSKIAIIIIISLFKVGFTITFHNYKPIGSSYTNQSANLLVFEINSFLKFS